MAQAHLREYKGAVKSYKAAVQLYKVLHEENTVDKLQRDIAALHLRVA